ncbi:MAG: MBL fold metallo-hydrolase, partial [Syntrophomonas sp.]
MIEQVLPDIYKVEIPLPNNPLKATNSYFIRGKKRNLLIDTGFNCDESRNAMVQGLHDLGARMETTDLFITHLHADHSGLTKYLATPSTTVWMSENDAKIVVINQAGSHWSMFSDFLHLSGLIASGIEDNVEKHPGYKYACEN